MFSFFKKLFKGFDPDITESEETTSVETGGFDYDALWEEVTSKLKDEVTTRISIPKGRAYFYIASKPHKDTFTYVGGYSVRGKFASFGIEAYCGDDGRDAIQALIDAAPKGHLIREAEAKQGTKNKTKWAWGVATSIELPREALVKWYVETIIAFYSFLESQKPLDAEVSDSAETIKPDVSREVGNKVSEARNYDKFAINGAGNYGKARMVEAVVNAYVQNNPQVTIEALQEVFPSHLLKGFGVIRTEDGTIKDYKRFYKSALPDGTVFYICNQWGKDATENFVQFVNENVAGITVSKVSDLANATDAISSENVSAKVASPVEDDEVEDFDEMEDFDEDEWVDCEEVEFDGVEYSVCDGEACASFLTDSDSQHLIIPKTIKDEDSNKIVVTEFDIDDVEDATHVTLPKTIKCVYGRAFSENDNVIVDFSGDPALVFENNVFYSADKKVLYNTQLATIGEEYIVPEGVETIDNDAFSNASSLKKLHLPSTIKNIYPAFDGCDKLVEVSIKASKDNVTLIKEDRDGEFAEVFGANVVVKFGVIPAEDAMNAADMELQKLKAEAEKLKAEAETARLVAEREAAAIKAEMEKAKAEAEAIRLAAEKEAAAAKVAIEKAKAEAEAARLTAEREAAAAKAEIEKAKAEAAKASAKDAPQKGASNEGALPGVFTLKDGKKIRFSKGNLLFHPKNYEFRFAEQQYERLSMADNVKCSPTLDGWIDIFGWGTSGYMGCQPTEDDLNAADYGPKSGDLTGDNANYDWGVFNPIANGGNKEGLWRTPSAEEWEYLANQRPNADKLKVKCTVCGVEGFMLMPDDFWNNRLRIAIDITTNSCLDNKFDSEQWTQLEELGAVFFSSGRYKYIDSKKWSWSTYSKNISHTSTRGYNGCYGGRDSSLSLCYKLPVRLIQDVK